MSTKQVNWTALRHSAADDAGVTGRRDRRKLATRDRLIDTATRMCMERGFEAVTVAEIARECGVATATVYNYFPSKESLIFDVPPPLLDKLRAALADPGGTPVDGMLLILDGVLDNLVTWLGAQDDGAWAAATVLRFEAMARDTPALQAHYLKLLYRMTDVAREALAHRTGRQPHEPEPSIAAAALLGLWDVQAEASCRALESAKAPQEVRETVAAQVRRAAGLLDKGLMTFG